MINDLLLDDIEGMSALRCQQYVAGRGQLWRPDARSGCHNRTRTLLEAIAKDEQPRNLVIAGLGGSGIGGQVLRAVLGHSTPIPIHLEQSHSFARLGRALGCGGWSFLFWN